MTIKDIAQITKKLVEDLGIHIYEIEIVTDHELDTTVINVRSPEKGVFSYNNSELLRALNHVVRRLVEQQAGSETQIPNYILDANSEQSRYIGELKKEARQAVSEAKQTGNTIALRPMNAYDRLIVHTFLACQNGVATESQGEGFERHITVQYSPIQE